VTETRGIVGEANGLGNKYNLLLGFLPLAGADIEAVINDF
jgi:hypothetical protein